MLSNNTTVSYTDPAWVFTTLNVTSSILFTIGFPSNAIIIYLVSKHRHLKNATNLFVSSLAIADLFVLIFMLFWIIGIKVIAHGEEIKLVYSSIDLFTGILSMLNVACVSADRAIAVTYPLRYERIVTRRRSLVITFSILCYSLCFLVAGLLRVSISNKIYRKAVVYICFGNFFVALSGTIISYTLIFLIVLHKLKGSRKLEKLMSYTRYTFNQETGDQDLSQEKKRCRRILFREIKVTGNILIIVLPFTIGWTFFIGTHFYEEVFKTWITNGTHNFFMIIVPWLLSVLNPIIYLLVNRSLRQTFCETVKKLCKSNDHYFLDESRFLASLSRRASSARTSSTTVEGSELMNLPLRNLRKSQSTNSARSSTSMDNKSASEAMPLSP